MRNRVVKRSKVYEQLVDFLLDDIQSGRFSVGDELPTERDMMEQFKVGRPAVREALLRLERMGLIDVSPGKRACVRRPTISRLIEEMGGAAKMLLLDERANKHFQDVRILLETSIARLAAKSVTDEELNVLRHTLENNLASCDDADRFADTDMAFHFELVKITHNPILEQMFSTMYDWLIEQRTTSLKVKGQTQTAYRSHQAIFKAIAARDADAAETAMREHLEQVQAVWRQAASLL